MRLIVKNKGNYNRKKNQQSCKRSEGTNERNEGDTNLKKRSNQQNGDKMCRLRALGQSSMNEIIS